jgi:hypothetical protein
LDEYFQPMVNDILDWLLFLFSGESDRQSNDDFWSSLLEFREQMPAEDIDADKEDTFVNLRDRSSGRNVQL